MVSFAFASCGNSNTDSADSTKSTASTEHTKILFTMENGETFTVETYPEYAPETCENFVNLVNSLNETFLNSHLNKKQNTMVNSTMVLRYCFQPEANTVKPRRIG